MKGERWSLHAQLTAKSRVAFRWQVFFDGKFFDKRAVHIAAEVERRGIHLQHSWQHAFQCDARRTLLQVQASWHTRAHFKVDCILGVPKSLTLPRGDSLCPDCCRVFHLADDLRVEHILCAGLRESLWRDHPAERVHLPS